ncbi:MAG: DNA cytosine methyltransferase [Rhodospirillales bacterium]
MLKGLDIFAGGGGSSYGARKAGIEMVGAIDMCDIATATYAENFPETHVVTAKLESIRLNRLRDQIGDIDILLASPECTNHTCAKGSAPRSEKSRATAMQVLRFARYFKPRWVVMENVIHMRPWSRYQELKYCLGEIGYRVSEQILDASDFGVAQKRRRLFVIGDRNDEPPTIKPRQKKPRVAADILDRTGIWKTTPLFRKDRAQATLERAGRGFRSLGKNSIFLLVYYGSDGSGGWQRIDRPLRTITTIDRFALIEPTEDGPTMRMLQVSELKRAMGFGTDYKMNIGTRRDKIRLLGNGVCPPVAATLIRALTP